MIVATGKEHRRYEHYLEFVSDLRRVFTNAIKYNTAHLTSDSTATSAKIVEAAEFLRDKLDDLLPAFTTSLCDRIQRVRIMNQELDLKEDEERQRREREEQDRREYERQIIMQLKQSDQAFAADLDIERKQRETAMMLQMERRANLVSMAAASPEYEEEDDSAREAMQAMGASAATVAGDDVLVFGFGVGGKVPQRFSRGMLRTKLQVRSRAWNYWLPFAVRDQDAAGVSGNGGSTTAGPVASADANAQPHESMQTNNTVVASTDAATITASKHGVSHGHWEDIDVNAATSTSNGGAHDMPDAEHGSADAVEVKAPPRFRALLALKPSQCKARPAILPLHGFR